MAIEKKQEVIDLARAKEIERKINSEIRYKEARLERINERIEKAKQEAIEKVTKIQQEKDALIANYTKEIDKVVAELNPLYDKREKFAPLYASIEELHNEMSGYEELLAPVEEAEPVKEAVAESKPAENIEELTLEEPKEEAKEEVKEEEKSIEVVMPNIETVEEIEKAKHDAEVVEAFRNVGIDYPKDEDAKVLENIDEAKEEVAAEEAEAKRAEEIDKEYKEREKEYINYFNDRLGEDVSILFYEKELEAYAADSGSYKRTKETPDALTQTKETIKGFKDSLDKEEYEAVESVLGPIEFGQQMEVKSVEEAKGELGDIVPMKDLEDIQEIKEGKTK